MWKVKQTQQRLTPRTNKAESQRQNARSSAARRARSGRIEKEELTVSKAALHPQFSLMRGRRARSGNSPTQLTVPAVPAGWFIFVLSVTVNLEA